MNSSPSVIRWTENQVEHCLDWHSENGAPAPKRIMIADDTINAETAYRLACEGTAILWRGDFHNAKNLLQAIARRIDKKPAKTKKNLAVQNPNPAHSFHLHRQAQLQRARILGMLIITINADLTIPLRRAPDVLQACLDVYGKRDLPFAISLRELLGVIGAHEWRKSGVNIPALSGKIHAHYGVFSPVRGEYLDLLAKAPLPSNTLAFDIGTGTGVIAAILARRGVQKVIATDLDSRALECAAENFQQLGITQVELLKTDLFPEGRAPLVVCNPPWIPARPNAAIEYAIYDPDSRMLKSFLAGVANHLEPNGEAWLIMSDLAEHLGLRTKEEFWNWIDAGGLTIVGKMDIRPQHGKANDANDPLHQARSAEITSLWRLRLK